MSITKSPLVTVYITNYNYGDYIKKAVDSVLSQSLQDFELIIIDDGSEDHSKEIIETYASYEHVTIIYQKNKGLNVTNNIALKSAQGKYIMRLDADDYLHEDALKVMSKTLDNDDDLGLVFPDYFNVDKDGNILSHEKRYSFEDDVKLLDMPAHGACTMIRVEALRNVGGYDEQYKCQDGYELWIKFIQKFKVNNINKPLFYYRQHGSNLTSNEEKILNTRALIKKNYVLKNKLKDLKTVTIIPVRGSLASDNNICFQKIKDEYIIDSKIKEALKSEKLGQIVISSPDEDIEKHSKDHYKEIDRVTFHKRPKEFARLNTPLDKTIESVLSSEKVEAFKPDIVLTLSIDYPLVTYKSFEDALNTFQIFKCDSVISVRKENSMLFQHDGSGMHVILGQDKFTKLERETLYKYEGGIMASTVKNFKKNKTMLSGKVGHTFITKKESLFVKSKFDLEIISYLAEK